MIYEPIYMFPKTSPSSNGTNNSEEKKEKKIQCAIKQSIQIKNL